MLRDLEQLEHRECPALASAGGMVYGLDDATGAVMWSRPLDPAFRGPLFVAGLADGDFLVGAGMGGGPRVVRFDGTTLAQEWSVFVGDPATRTGVSVAAFDATRVSVPGPTPAPAPPLPGPAGGFRIDAQASGFADGGHVAAIQSAARRWEQVIGSPNRTLTIDVRAISIDGPGGSLGQATWDRLAPDGLPDRGFVEIDAADLAAYGGMLYGITLHEIGHVLGVGTLWSHRGLIAGADTSNPAYVGPNAVREYGGPVPVEAGYGPGSALAHWRESVFGRELMTPALNAPHPLSRVTVASLADLGYGVNLDAADPFAPGPSLEPSAGLV